MSADKIVLTADITHAPSEYLVVAPNRQQPVFWLALLCAAAVHAVLVLGISRASPRYMGEHGGRPDVINVDLIDEAEFQSKTPVPSRADNPPAALATAAQPPRPDATRASEAALPQQSADAPPLEMEKPEVPSPPDAEVKRSVTELARNYELKQPTQLDLTVPFNSTMRDASSGAQGWSSSATRPPGVTRSGENDEFGRGVIRGLKKTMPPPDEVKGRVTIRIFLNERGNISEVKLVQGSGNRDLDQSVVFSARQATFPFPPEGATVADRTFRVTYVYR